ncbi:EAL domain-containing protein [Komagataeibacter medellinensis]|uniref:EAL domain-containing protein n=1 Tax=Komagataeibacter medellinensis TaxID=1177712 RepID=A0ABQ6VRR0_9PROT|nr:EAL domain-containing protein [Komagataeibacter medellinensis]KAB8122627.1 EAL domain-containing protein [Komagataeibacter medellinensis]
MSKEIFPVTTENVNSDICMDMLEQARDGVIIIDERNCIVFFNRAAQELWGYTQAEVMGRNVKCLVPMAYRGEHDSFIAHNRNTGINRIVGTSREITFESKSGDYVSAEMSISTALIGPDRKRYYMAFMKGVTEESHRKKLLDLQNTVFRSLSGDMLIQDVADLVCQGVEEFVPNSVAVLMLLTADRTLQILSGAGLPRRFATALENMTLTDADITALANDLDEASSVVWESYRSLGISLGLNECWASAIRAPNGRIAGILALYSRNKHEVAEWPRKIVAGAVPFCGVVIEQYEARQHISQLANYDPLTGFLNRSSLHRMLRSMISQPGDNHFAVLLLDLDRFRDINDALGHIQGDTFLKVIAERLKTLCRSNYIVSRSGGDDFVIVIPNATQDMAVDFTKTLIAAMQRPLDVAGNQLSASFSIGIATFPENGPDGESLISHAEMAMRLAKKEARGSYRLVSAIDSTEAQDRLVLSSALRESLSKGLLNLHYQPQIEARTGDIYGVEALARWNHPTLGTIFPSRFIAVAEETGQIEAIGRWSLEEACRQITRWEREGVHIPVVSVNLSAGHFHNRSLVPMIAGLLEKYGLAPERLTVEITESVMMEESDETMNALSHIRKLGVGLSMDDFGTGFSSLSRLTRLPLTEIKIDRSFIMNLDHDPNAQAVTTAVIGIGNRLGMTVVTEGVETEAQYDLLERLHCDVLQGYLFARPMSATDLAAWARQPRMLMPAMQRTDRA